MPTLEVIQEKLKRLQAQADVLIAKKAQSALDQIRRLMLEHGLTTEDIEAKAKAKREAKGAGSPIVTTKRKGSNALGTKVAPSFRIRRAVPRGPAVEAHRLGSRKQKIAPSS